MLQWKIYSHDQFTPNFDLNKLRTGCRGKSCRTRKKKLSLEQLVDKALYALLKGEDDVQMLEFVENRDNDPEVEAKNFKGDC